MCEKKRLQSLEDAILVVHSPRPFIGPGKCEVHEVEPEELHVSMEAVLCKRKNIINQGECGDCLLDMA